MKKQIPKEPQNNFNKDEKNMKKIFTVHIHHTYTHKKVKRCRLVMLGMNFGPGEDNSKKGR